MLLSVGVLSIFEFESLGCRLFYLSFLNQISWISAHIHTPVIFRRHTHSHISFNYIFVLPKIKKFHWVAMLLSLSSNDIIKPNIWTGYYLHFITLIVHCLYDFIFALVKKHKCIIRSFILYTSKFALWQHFFFLFLLVPEKPFSQIRFILFLKTSSI